MSTGADNLNDPRGTAWTDAFMSLSRALWARVTPDLRWVSIGLVDDVVVARFAYEGQPDDSRLEYVSDAETEVLADLWPAHTTDFQAVQRPPAQPPVLEDGTHWWAYLRYEPVESRDVVCEATTV